MKRCSKLKSIQPIVQKLVKARATLKVLEVHYLVPTKTKVGNFKVGEFQGLFDLCIWKETLMKHIELPFDLLTIKRLELKTCCKLASQVDRHLFSALGPSQGHKSGRLIIKNCFL